MAIVGRTKGKALLVIERLDSQWVKFDVRAHIFSQTQPVPCGYYVNEEFQLIETSSITMPRATRNMVPGDRIWVLVTYEFIYCRDYWGEYDMDATYHKQRVIKRTSIKNLSRNRRRY